MICLLQQAANPIFRIDLKNVDINRKKQYKKNMSIHFAPRFSLTASIKRNLLFIEQVRSKTASCTPCLKKEARQQESYYFRLMEEISSDAHEIKGYLAAYDEAMNWSGPLSEALIKKIHGKILHSSRATPYRKGQSGVLDPSRQKVLYLAPKAEDVPLLMKDLVNWVNTSTHPWPITAAVAHFGINSIHPYYDGNGRCARLVTKCILHQAGYDVCGLLCLENFYAKDINLYYKGLTINNTADYYSGPARLPITSWLEYFCSGMAYSTKQAFIKLRKIK